jgi:hypothetical protein
VSITDIPVELMTADQRVERIGELRSAMRREWGRFVLTEAAVIFGPLGVFLAVYVVSDEISQHALYAAVGFVIVAETALVLYWVVRRIMPIGRRLEELGVQPFEDD